MDQKQRVVQISRSLYRECPDYIPMQDVKEFADDEKKLEDIVPSGIELTCLYYIRVPRVRDNNQNYTRQELINRYADMVDRGLRQMIMGTTDTETDPEFIRALDDARWLPPLSSAQIDVGDIVGGDPLMADASSVASNVPGAV